MKAQKKFARFALAAGLTATMAFGNVAAPTVMAFADTGSAVTFADADYATSTTYKGIQIFKAIVATTGEDTKVSNIEWASDAAKEAVVAAIKAKDTSFASDHAQDAADWLNANAGVDGTDSKVASDNVLSLIAANLEGKPGWETTTAGNPSLSNLEAGYWLFLTATAGKPDGKSTDAFTSPVYAVIDGVNPTTITPKKGVPTVEKKVLDDADAVAPDIKGSDRWKDVADSQIGQEVNYRLTGTIASNYATFSTYAYKFTDVLSDGLDYVNGSVEVYAVNGGTYSLVDANKYDVAWDAKTLTVEFKVDEFPKNDTDEAKLAKLRGAFPVGPEGVEDEVVHTFELTGVHEADTKKHVQRVTAANASGINDGAAALVLASAEAVEKYGLKPMAKLIGYGQGGVDPKIMGVGPVPASRNAMAAAGVSIEDIDLVEANEAFAAQSIAVGRELGFDMAKVNVNGGAISLGHPVGASGARIIVTLLHEMQKRDDAKKGLATLCIGGGMGTAVVVEKC